MKKSFIIFAFIFFMAQNTFAAESIENADTKKIEIKKETELYREQNLLGREKTDKAQIRELFSNLNKYSNEHNTEAIKKFYSKDYISYDGFNFDAFFASVDETFKIYPDISYKSKIKSINIIGNWAAVELIDITTSEKQAATQAIINNKPVMDRKIEGTMESLCHYVTYLRKTGGKWQIYSDNIITEETAIKYGKAAEIDMNILSPLVVKGGEEYCISLNIKDKPKGALGLASLSREEIKYPPAAPVDKFRKIPSDGTLERVVIANKKGINEYSMASVGITEISLNEEKTAINYEMAGVAFLMKRVNVYGERNAVDLKYLKEQKEKAEQKTKEGNL